MIFFFLNLIALQQYQFFIKKNPKTLVHKCKQEIETCKGGIYSLQMVHA